ncbi:MAG: hypothetical protein JEZ14_26335 [Marinilabiliaceae bacterium]|nr:hypothetical protein [Marinilabiliaceae bacterium]
MSNQEQYSQLLPEAKAMDPKEVKSPYMPVGIYLQEAEDLRRWSLVDKVKLLGAGLPESIFEDLDVRAGALREAQSIWMEDVKAKQEAEEEWAEESPKAYDLRNQLVHTFRYAYRENEAVLDRVRTIAEGSGHADMIQDLNDLAVLGRKNPEPLVKINCDTAVLEESAQLSATMADLRAMANGERLNMNETLHIRNAMYTILKQRVDQIRDCGKYLFWRNEKRLIGYTSNYNRKQNN